MRRRLICALCVVTCLLSACQSQNLGKSTRETATFYYRSTTNQTDSAFAEESYAYEEGTDAVTVLNAYLEGPYKEGSASVLPKGTHLVSCEVNQQVGILTMSESMALLTGADLTIGAACLSLTAMSVLNVTTVRISAENTMLDGEPYLQLSASDLLLEDRRVESMEQTLTVYFSDADFRYLLSEDVTTTLTDLPSQARFLIQTLIDGSSTGNVRTIPKGTKLLDVTMDGGTCIVDFSYEFYRNRPESELEERMTILSVTDTLTALDGIDQVEFLIEGEQYKQYYKMDLSTLYQWDETAIGPVRTGMNELDASFYVKRISDGALAEVPTRMKQVVNMTEAEQLLQALIDFDAMNGYTAAIPKETKVLSVEEAGSLCRIDLSGEFATGCKTAEEERMAVTSIVRTMTAMEKITAVQITIDGGKTKLRNVDLSKPLDD